MQGVPIAAADWCRSVSEQDAVPAGPGAMASVALGETAEANDAVPDALGQEVLAGETLWGGIESRFLWREICHTVRPASSYAVHCSMTCCATLYPCGACRC